MTKMMLSCVLLLFVGGVRPADGIRGLLEESVPKDLRPERGRKPTDAQLAIVNGCLNQAAGRNISMAVTSGEAHVFDGAIAVNFIMPEFTAIGLRFGESIASVQFADSEMHKASKLRKGSRVKFVGEVQYVKVYDQSPETVGVEMGIVNAKITR